MVGRLVHPQGAALLAQTVPAPEVIGAVAGVEVPGEVDARDLADLAREQGLLDLLVLGRVAVVEGHADLAPRSLLRVEHGLALDLVDGHRLLGDDVDPAVERLHDAVAVKGVDGGDAEKVGLGRGQHLVEAGEGRAGDPDRLLGRLHPKAVDVAKAHELEDVGIARDEGPPPHADAADARAHDGVAPPGPRGLRQARARQKRRRRRPPRRRHELAPRHAFFACHARLSPIPRPEPILTEAPRCEHRAPAAFWVPHRAAGVASAR